MLTIPPAISVRQPWAAALLYLGKDVENRTWPLPAKYVNKPLLLHAGMAKPRLDEWPELLFDCAMLAPCIIYGGIIGEIVFGPSVQDSPSPWAESGLWHWPVASVNALEFWQCKGRLGIFKVDYQEPSA